MSCDHVLANEWARCSGKNASYITSIFILSIEIDEENKVVLSVVFMVYVVVVVIVSHCGLLLLTSPSP